MAFPIIPVLSVLGLFGAVATIRWYANLSTSERNNANQMALHWFGKGFEELSDSQQNRIRERI